MADYELDRLFGMALTDVRFFQHLRERPHQAVAEFALTESETRAVMHIAPVARTIEDLAEQLDTWMTQREPVPACAEPQLIGLHSAAEDYAISNDILLQMVQDGRIRLSEHDVSQIALQVMSNQYA